MGDTTISDDGVNLTIQQRRQLKWVVLLLVALILGGIVYSWYLENNPAPFTIQPGESLLSYTDGDFETAIAIAAAVPAVVIEAKPAPFAADGMPPSLLEQVTASRALSENSYAISATLALALAEYTDVIRVNPIVYPGDTFYPAEPERFEPSRWRQSD